MRSPFHSRSPNDIWPDVTVTNGSPPVCGLGHMRLCTAACGAHTCAREPLMHFEPSGAAGAARPLTFDDSHPYCLLYYLAYNDRKVKYNERNGQGVKQGQDSHLQRANWCTIVLCEIFPGQFSFAGCAFHFSLGSLENRNRRVQFRISTILDPARARPERHHALDQSRVRRPIP